MNHVRGIIYAKENPFEVILIQRIRDALEYYVFPGGSIENIDCFKSDGKKYKKDEILSNALKREAKEELGIDIEVISKYAKIKYNHETHIFFICKQIGGVLGSGEGEEYTEQRFNQRGSYVPMLVNIINLYKLNLVPEKIKLKLLNYKNR
jgi:8-oxo-dGTP pyrophosphatase MutT (NUDIX family)